MPSFASVQDLVLAAAKQGPATLVQLPNGDEVMITQPAGGIPFL